MNTTLALADRVAVVTGGGGGIGRATALELAVLGARVVVADLDEGSARLSAQAVEERGASLGLTALARPEASADALDMYACSS
jgi:NAD(P)-dependent dehydrogenase (short-subunit alcohol dehydrogenase family)